MATDKPDITVTLMKDGNSVAEGTYAEDANGRPSQGRDWRGSFITASENKELALASIDLNGNPVDGFSIDFGAGPRDVVVVSSAKRTEGLGYLVVVEGSGPNPA